MARLDFWKVSEEAKEFKKMSERKNAIEMIDGKKYGNVHIILLPNVPYEKEEFEYVSEKLIKAVQDMGEGLKWKGKIHLVGSYVHGELTVKQLSDYTGGRRKLKFHPKEGVNEEDMYTYPHLHILLETAKPYTTIRDYFTSYWVGRNPLDYKSTDRKRTFFTIPAPHKQYLRAEYFKAQSSFERNGVIGE